MLLKQWCTFKMESRNHHDTHGLIWNNVTGTAIAAQLPSLFEAGVLCVKACAFSKKIARLNFKIYFVWHANKLSIACDSKALPSKWPGVAFDNLGWGCQDVFDKHVWQSYFHFEQYSDLVHWVKYSNFVELQFLFSRCANAYVKGRMNEKFVRGNRVQVVWFVWIQSQFALIVWFVSIAWFVKQSPWSDAQIVNQFRMVNP